MKEEIPDKNLFMMCKKINRDAFSKLPRGYQLSTCKKDELDIWKAMPFDDLETADKYYNFMTNYFNNVYAPKGDLFYRKCLFVRNEDGVPIATCFIWQTYGKINTIHWFKVLKDYEGRGIGRALLTHIMKDKQESDFPVYLHTQPGSYRAIKLYSDFGFALLADKIIGYRENDLEESLPILKNHMPYEDYKKLQISAAPIEFLEAVRLTKLNQF